MQNLKYKNHFHDKSVMSGGFTLIEVIIACSIMVILCVGTLTVFSHASKINTGNNLRAQAQSVLQLEAEYYRGLKFIPIGSDSALNGGTYTNVRERSGADCPVGVDPPPDVCLFRVSVVIDNNPSTTAIDTGNESTCKFKQIKITAVPKIARAGWLASASLNTNLVIQRVRAN
jgi:prepilin-type N-terminal cleavage/methylation domain-containing protein